MVHCRTLAKSCIKRESRFNFLHARLDEHKECNKPAYISNCIYKTYAERPPSDHSLIHCVRSVFIYVISYALSQFQVSISRKRQITGVQLYYV